MTDEIGARVRKLVIKSLGVDRAQVVPKATLIDDLGADSLDAVEMIMAAEEEFGCDITDEEAEAIVTVQDAIDLVRRKLPPQPN